MYHDFLKNFDKRIKKAGPYILLCKNSINRNTWKSYHFEEIHEYMNLILAIMLYIMEQSLKEEPCTIDDIASFIDNINSSYFRKPLSYEQCKELGDFVVNTVLCDEGKPMYFKGFNFEENDFKDIHISFVSNKVIYINDIVKRVSYYLADDGYSLLLSTLEIEDNMKITINEFIFSLHLKKASYDKAVDEIKNIFNLLRIQHNKMNEATRKIRENALNYSVIEYREILEGNMESLESTRRKFHEYKQYVADRIKDIKEKEINIQKLDDDQKNLKLLSIISDYLSKVIDEQQKILSSHFDFKSIYSKELREISSMTVMKRFNINSEIYQRIIKDSSKLDSIDTILRPLFKYEVNKFYNINKSLQHQRAIRDVDNEEDESIEFDEEQWVREKEQKQREKLKKYKKCLTYIINFIYNKKESTLYDISNYIKYNEDEKDNLIPSIEIFREVMIELLKHKNIDIEMINKESKNVVKDNNLLQFNLNEVIIEILRENENLSNIKSICVSKVLDNKFVRFYKVCDEKGFTKTLECPNLFFKIL